MRGVLSSPRNNLEKGLKEKFCRVMVSLNCYGVGALSKSCDSKIANPDDHTIASTTRENHTNTNSGTFATVSIIRLL